MSHSGIRYSHENLAAGSDDALSPGPVDPQHVPKPTEIICIETLKVYDFCFQQEIREPTQELCFKKVDLTEPFEISCEVVDFTCVEVDREPVGPEGLQEVTLEITYRLEICIIQDSKVACDHIVDTFRKTIILCAPEGTEIDCHTFTEVQCEDVFINNIIDNCRPARATVTATVVICLVVQSRALVKLLVPSFGFCFPAPCVEAPFVKPCPPEPLFPPQC